MAKKKGFNDYNIIDNNTTEIFITRRNGDKFTVLIDTEDLSKLIDLDYRWTVYFDRYMRDYYCNATVYIVENGIKRSVIQKLNRLLLNYNGKNVVDHINRKPLDNHKINLRIINKSKNAQNRKGKNINNKTGYRNVCFYDNWYLVQLQIEGKNKILGKFKNVDDAGRFAEEMRTEYYGEYAGKS